MWAEIQSHLKDKGLYTGEIDGIPGAQTAKAVADYMGIAYRVSEALTEHFPFRKWRVPAAGRLTWTPEC